jgi:DNA-binding transcriptional MerR regulator
MGTAPLERFAVRSVLAIAAILMSGICLAADRPHVIVVVGAEGTPEYGAKFREWAQRWESAAKKGQATTISIGASEENESDRSRLQTALKDASQGTSPLWVIFIGHGTFDGKTAKFNLRGEDIAAGELAQWLQPLERPIAIANCSSCSGGFLAELSGKDRVVITATKSGHEYNFARFGDYLSAAIADPNCDLDKDDQTSLLEAFLFASSQVREFYSSNSRLATEHSLIDDNGDRQGTPADWFKGLKPTKAAKGGAALEGDLARMFVLVPNPQEETLSEETRARRDELEKQLADLRRRKETLDEAAYFSELERLLVELARLAKTAAK